MLADFLAGLSAAKSGLEVIKTIQDIKDQSKIQDKVQELNHVINVLQTSLYAVNTALLFEQERRAEAEKELKETKEKQIQFENYVLHQLPTGAFVYRSKPDLNDNKPIHSICTNCYAKGFKSILQPQSRNLVKYLVCPHCQNQLVGG